MAPVTRNRQPLFDTQSQLRDNTWGFTSSGERLQQEFRAVSEDPGSYDGNSADGEFIHTQSNRTLTMTTPTLHGPDSHDDILHPLREAANRVGRQVEEFAEVLDKYNPLKTDDQMEKHEMVFEMVNVLHGVAIETVEKLRKVHKPGRSGRKKGVRQPKMRGFLNRDVEDDVDMDTEEESSPLELQAAGDTTARDLARWEDEVHTWDLFIKMLELRYPLPGTTQRALEPIHKYSSERQVYQNLLIADTSARERSVVLNWLKDTANDSGDEIDDLVKDLQQNADRGDIVAHGWIHTKAFIKSQKRINTWSNVVDPTAPEVKRIQRSSKAENIVTQLDPDTPDRQGRNLETQDQYFERAIWLGCYELLRRGKTLGEIKEWCAERTEIWRAVSMSGLVDFEDDTDATSPEYTSTMLWRRMCYALAKRSGADPYEKAVYGVLSGDFESVNAVSKSWDDQLYAHFNALLRTQFEAYTTEQTPSPRSDIANKFPIFDAIQYHGGEGTAIGAKLIKSLRLNPALKSEANEPMKLIQGALISNNLTDFMLQQGIAYSKESGESSLLRRVHAEPEDEANLTYMKIEDHDSMRVMVHMLIAIKGLGENLGFEETTYAVENILACYINFLRLSGKEELIPVYAVQLSEERCYDVLSRTMIDVIDDEQRGTQVELMFNLGLDVQRVIKLQTSNLLIEYPDPLEANADFSLKLLLPRKADQSTELIRATSGRGSKKIREEQELCRVNPDFLNEPIARNDLLLVRSLEWHLLVDGLWSITYRTGADLYKRFFMQGKLSAAKLLSDTLPAEDICLDKTSVLLGASLSLEDLRNEDSILEFTDEDDIAPLRRRGLLQRHMLAEAKSYVELEKLMHALENIWEAGHHVDAYEATTDMKTRKDHRMALHQTIVSLRPIMGMLLSPNWLKTSVNPEPAFPQIRQLYLPEVVLAFDHILKICGTMLSRDGFLECLNLATFVADEKNDLAELFLQGDRMTELVQAFADDSLGLLVATGPGKSRGDTNKKLRALGWKRSIWEVPVPELPEEIDGENGNDSD